MAGLVIRCGTGMFRVCSCFVAGLVAIGTVWDGVACAATVMDTLPAPTALVRASDEYSLPLMKGVRFDPQDPLNLEFMFDPAHQQAVSKEEASRLVRYFLAGLTLPEDDLWVNLSPYESDRVVPETLGATELGRDMLATDYLLKQVSSSLTHPDTETGRQYWNLKSEISDQEFNKIWIMPDRADVYEASAVSAFVVDARLKAMTEADYLAMCKAEDNSVAAGSDDRSHLRETSMSAILPAVTREINQGRHFAELRQIYHSLILSSWFKAKFRDTFFKSYFDQAKIRGVDLAEPEARDRIYGLYCEAFEKGVFDYDRKERDAATQRLVKRHYFSGGELLKTSSVIHVLPQTPASLKFVSSSCVSWRARLDDVSSSGISREDMIERFKFRRPFINTVNATGVKYMAEVADLLEYLIDNGVWFSDNEDDNLQMLVSLAMDIWYGNAESLWAAKEKLYSVGYGRSEPDKERRSSIQHELIQTAFERGFANTRGEFIRWVRSRMSIPENALGVVEAAFVDNRRAVEEILAYDAGVKAQDRAYVVDRIVRAAKHVAYQESQASSSLDHNAVALMLKVGGAALVAGVLLKAAVSYFFATDWLNRDNVVLPLRDSIRLWWKGRKGEGYSSFPDEVEIERVTFSIDPQVRKRAIDAVERFRVKDFSPHILKVVAKLRHDNDPVVRDAYNALPLEKRDALDAAAGGLIAWNLGEGGSGEEAASSTVNARAVGGVSMSGVSSAVTAYSGSVATPDANVPALRGLRLVSLYGRSDAPADSLLK